jgi:hypothetical protein
MYVMILVAIKLFLRADEVVTIKVDSYLAALFARVGTIAHALGLTSKTPEGTNNLDGYLDVAKLTPLTLYAM